MLQSTHLKASVHALRDLNLATLNYPIWRESVKQVCTCISQASALDRQGNPSPRLSLPDRKDDARAGMDQQKAALREIGQCAVEHGVLACLENMISIKNFLCRRP